MLGLPLLGCRALAVGQFLCLVNHVLGTVGDRRVAAGAGLPPRVTAGVTSPRRVISFVLLGSVPVGRLVAWNRSYLVC